jgi:hypothetical protein
LNLITFGLFKRECHDFKVRLSKSS